MRYEELLSEATVNEITVVEQSLESHDGLCYENLIIIDKSIQTQAQRACVLAEELSHYYINFGDIIDQNVVENRKQEYKARLLAYNKMIGLHGIINAYKNHCRNRYEVAEYLDVTESFLCEALDFYKSKYGTFTTLDNYVIYFEPLSVLELLSQKNIDKEMRDGL